MNKKRKAITNHDEASKLLQRSFSSPDAEMFSKWLKSLGFTSYFNGFYRALYEIPDPRPDPVSTLFCYFSGLGKTILESCPLDLDEKFVDKFRGEISTWKQKFPEKVAELQKSIIVEDDSARQTFEDLQQARARNAEYVLEIENLNKQMSALQSNIGELQLHLQTREEEYRVKVETIAGLEKYELDLHRQINSY